MWRDVLLGQVATIEVGGTPSTEVPAYWGGDIPWMVSGDVHRHRVAEVEGRITSVGLSASNAKVIEPPAVAVALAGQGRTRGTAALTLIPLCTNQSIALIRADNHSLDTVYLFHMLKNRYEELRGRSSGGGRGGLTKAILSTVPLCLPPIEEQRRIVQVLDTNDEVITRSEAVIAKLRLLKAGLMHDLLTRGLADSEKIGEIASVLNDLRDGRLAPVTGVLSSVLGKAEEGFGKNGGHWSGLPLRDPVAHPDQFKETVLGLVPKCWNVTTLGAAISDGGGFIQTGPFGSQLHANEYTAEGVPVVMPQDILDGTIVEKNIARIPPTRTTTLRRHLLEVGDVVFGRRGELNRCAAIGQREKGWICGTGCLLSRLPNTVHGPWLAAIYRHDVSQRQINARAVGSTMVNLNTGLLNTLAIAIPPVVEQKAIIEIICTHDSRLRAEEAYREKLVLQKHGLMSDLLTGRVRAVSA